jgi:hypothetical protein
MRIYTLTMFKTAVVGALHYWFSFNQLELLMSMLGLDQVGALPVLRDHDHMTDHTFVL